MNNGFSSYYFKNSYLHRFNPTLKIIILIFFVVMIFLPIGFFGQTLLLILFIVGWSLSKLPIRMIWSIIKSCIVMFVILLLVNWMTYKSPGLFVDNSHVIKIFDFNLETWIFNKSHYFGQNPTYYSTGMLLGEPNAIIYNSFSTSMPELKATDWSFVTFKDGDVTYYLPYVVHWYSLSTQAIFKAISITFKIFLMIGIITLIISTTNPVQLSFAIEDLLHPLTYIRFPVNEWAMTISIALRFVPSLLEESQKVMRAQASRGVDFSNGNYKDKIKSIVSLVVPMFSIAFRKADDLANAMEARAYNPRFVRTRYRNYDINTSHWIITSVVIIFFGFFVMFSAKHMLFAPFGWIETLSLYGVTA